MKKNIKRMLAFLLAIATVWSLIPTMAIAVGEEDLGDQLPTTVVYDFAVQNTDLVDTNGKSLGNGLLTNAAVKNAIDAYYASETLNWKFAANNYTLLKTETNTVNDASYFGGTSYTWKGLRTGVNVKEGTASDYPAGYWVALHIRVSVAGTYEVTLNYQTRADGAKVGEVYFLPGALTNPETIDAALTVDNLEETVDFTSNSWTPADATTSMGEMLLEQGEYTVVFKAAEKKAGASSAYMFLNDLTVNLQEQAEALEEADYDFSQTALVDAIGGSYTNEYFYDLPDTTLSEAYADGEINWQIAASNKDSFIGDTYSATKSYLSYGNGSNWSGLRLAVNADPADGSDPVYLTDYWFAFNIKSPGEGDYDVTLNYQTRADANQDVKVYLLPGGMTDPAQIQTALDSAEALTTGFDGRTNNNGTLNKTWTLADAAISLGTLTMADDEYTLVVHCASNSGNYFFLNGLHMVAHRELPPEETTTAPEQTTTVPEETTAVPEETTVPEETVPEEYDPADPEGGLRYHFALSGTALTREDGTSFAGGRLSGAGEKNAIEGYYTDGTLHWKYALDNLASMKTDTNTVADTYYFGLGNGYKWTGLRLGVNVKEGEDSTYPAGYWTAFTVQSPGKGSYDLTLKYQDRADGTEKGEIYLLKGTYTDTAAVEAAMTEDTLLKTVSFKSKSWELTDLTADLGTVDLEKGEYTLVFKAAAGAAAGAYFYINELIAEPHAEKPTIQVDSLEYNFALQDTDLTTTDGKSFATAIMDNANAAQAIKGYYDANKLYWTYADDNLDLLKTDTNTVASTYYFGGGNYAWSGLRLGVNIKEGESSTYPAGYWTAFTVLSPGKGNYQLTLDYQTRADGTSAGEVYLLKGTFKNATAIEAALSKAAPLQTINFKSATWTLEDNQAELGILALEKGEYTLVFKATEGAEAGAYMYINKLSALHESLIPAPPAPPQLDTGIYDFVLEDTDLTYSGDKSFAAAVFTNQAVQSAIEKYYKNGDLNWKFHSAYIPTGSTSQGAMFGGTAGGKTYSWNGLRFYSMGVSTPMWQAFTIQSPGTGTYYPAFNYMKNIAGASVGKIYLLPGDTQDVAKAIASGKAIAEVSYDNRTGGDAEAASQIFYDQPLKLTAGEEYILVFTAEEPGVKTGENKFAYIYLNQFILYSEKTLPDPGPNVVTYDFDVTDKANGIYTEGKVDMEDIKSDIANRYAKGEIQWKLEEKAATMAYDVTFVQYAGMTSYSNEDDWMAFRCKAPGDGVYTLTMNYATSSNGALGAVYILPGDTQDVEFAMDHSNRIKKVAFYNESGAASTVDGSTVTLGTWDFTGEDEFIIVFEAYDNSPYSNFAYMWVSQVIATEGNHAKEEEAGRQINSILVDAEPVKTYETTQYGTTAVVNGQDYLFVPVEGKKMVIYNMDDMVKVGTVRTPFSVCRGITTDKDGIIWLVGDKPVVFRYDPITEVSTTTRNYGTYIPECYGGFSVTTDDEGNLFFGTYQRAAVVKYEPSTDKFTNLGEFNDDAGYSCGVIIKDNYLYVGITGDRNGDGLRTTEMLKIDITTNQCVDRLDITEQVGPDEVMVRGTGIGGDTLFVGGIQMDAFIAIDINTMELKQYEGFRKQIAYCGTQEVNGKIYFTAADHGLCEYDIATDTITSLKMETATYGLRCGQHSFITLDDPLYPGNTIVTYRSEGIILYNPQSKQANYIVDMLDEEADGSGMNIISMAVGPEGTNEVYLGSFNTVNCTAISTLTGKISRIFEATGSQTDAILWYEGVLYTGNYNNGAIVRINPEDEHRNVILLSMNNDIHEQNRVHCLAAGDGKLFAGTMPRTDTYDGALVMIDLETLENTFVRNIVEGCSVTGLTYADGLVFGATSYSGGTGTDGPKNDTISAKIFVYDSVKKEKVGELDPRDYFSGLPDQVPYIDAIAVDPDYETNGRVWAMVSETLFCFTFDETTGKFSVKQVLSYSLTDFPGNNNRYARATQILFKDGYLYVAMGNKGGMHKVNLSDYSDHSRLNCETPRCFVIAEDGNLYYSIGTSELKMYPLDVTEADWLSAEAVDALIKAIGKVSLDSEEAIIAARTAYDALSWKHKALVQTYDILQIAETDLLEAKIDTIGEVTKEDQALIEGLVAQYNAMTAKEQKYVKNYSVLVQARKALQAILDAEKAAEVQKLIDSIKEMGEITLEDEDAIIAIREAYDALTFAQKQLVNITALLDAEAKITALRQVRIDRLKELIASIGEVTLEDEAIINEAMEIYDWLHIDEREQVDYVTLIAAEKALIKLQKEAAANVDALIEAIGDSVSYSSGDAIAAARAAYDALTEGSKKYVTLLHILEEAEALYAELFPLWAIIVIAVTAVAAAAAVVTVMLLRKRKAKATQAPTEQLPTQETPAE